MKLLSYSLWQQLEL